MSLVFQMIFFLFIFFTHISFSKQKDNKKTTWRVSTDTLFGEAQHTLERQTDQPAHGSV